MTARMQNFWEDDLYEALAKQMGSNEDIKLSVHVFHLLRDLLRSVKPSNQCALALSRCTSTIRLFSMTLKFNKHESI